jgi:DNA repair exonuclease SbcCD ATPase subunit
MKIDKLKIKNFYCFVKTELNFSQYQGLTLIKGVNKDNFGSNGSGKSALLEAVFFGLTGKTVRKSTEVALINNKTKKGCVVEIQLDNGVTIRRSKKPTKLELFINGENKTKEHASATQAYIDEVLNINYKILLSSMFFGQTNTLNFLDADANDKRLILRNFLNLEEIFTLRDRIKTFKSDFWSESKVQDSLVEEFEKSKQTLEEDLSKIDSKSADYLQGYEDYLDISLEDLLGREKLIENVSSKKISLERSIDNALDGLNNLLNEMDDNSCRHCGQSFPEGHWDQNKSLVTKKNEEIRVLEDELDSIVCPEPHPISSSEYSSVLELKDLISKEKIYEDQIKDHISKISNARNKKIESNKNYEIMRFWEKAFSEQGIIKYIIRNVLSYFNDRINYYLSFLTNQGYYLEFDEELSEKILVSDQLVHYISLSGGEKRKINLSVLLALRDLLAFTDKNQLDIIFFDEVAENLDEEGIQGLHHLLNEIKKTKNVFVITHNKHLKTLLDSAPRITIIKDNGEAKIIGKVKNGSGNS